MNWLEEEFHKLLHAFGVEWGASDPSVAAVKEAASALLADAKAAIPVVEKAAEYGIQAEAVAALGAPVGDVVAKVADIAVEGAVTEAESKATELVA